MNNTDLFCVRCRSWFYEKCNFGDICPDCLDIHRCKICNGETGRMIMDRDKRPICEACDKKGI